jgi:acyl carrier protein
MIAVIDMDGTIIDTVYDSNITESSNVKRLPKFVSSFGADETIALRPNVRALLAYCRIEFDEVILCTFSKWSRAKSIVELFNLDLFFDEIIGREKIMDEKRNLSLEDFVIVEDSSLYNEFTVKKMEYLGFDVISAFLDNDAEEKIKNSFIKVSSYEYNKKEDDEMNRVIFRMKDKMSEEHIFSFIKNSIIHILDDEDVSYVNRKSNVFIDLVMDEFSLAELSFTIEEEFGIEISEEEMSNVVFVYDLCEIIKKKVDSDD